MEEIDLAKDCSFDIVSKIDMPEVTNAVTAATKEIATRYDFKGSKSEIKLDKDKEELVLVSDDEFKLEQLKDVLLTKLIKRGVPIGNLDYGKVEGAASATVRQRAKLMQGIDRDNAKILNALIKNSGVKVKTQIQDDQMRVTGKNKDDLQKIIALVRAEEKFTVEMQFVNYR